MFYDFLIFLPAFACLFWMVIFCKMSSRTSTFQPLMLLAAVAVLFFFSDSAYASPNAGPRALIVAGLVGQLAAPSMLPLAWMYLLRLRGQQHFRSDQMLWIVFPAVLGATALLLTLLSGPDRIIALQTRLYNEGISQFFRGGGEDPVLQMYAMMTVVVFRAVLAGETLVYGGLMLALARKENYRLRHLRKFNRGERIRVAEFQYFVLLGTAVFFLPKIVLLHATLESHPWISALLGVLITAGLFTFCYASLFGARHSFSRAEARIGFRYNYDEPRKAEIVEQMISDLVEEAEEEALKRIQEKIGHNLHIEEWKEASGPGELPGTVASSIFSAVAKSWDDDSLLSRFEALMLHEQAFLEPGLTLNGVAERLHSNKTYVSRLVNNSYNLAFPDLINTLRIDYAEQYIIAHRDAKQSEIAAACGFTSASSFNNVFKKVTGMTPKIWLVTYDRENPGSAPADQTDKPDNL